MNHKDTLIIVTKMVIKLNLILMLFIVLNLVISPISMALAAEAQNPVKMEVASYKIGNRIIETTSSANANMASMESKVMTAQGYVKPLTVSEASGKLQSNVMAELSDQPIVNIKSELSADKKSRKIILKINIENIGNVKAKNIKAATESNSKAEALYVKGGRVSAKEAIWTGEIEAGKSQELIYEFMYQGNVTQDLTVPFTISGSGSDEWILNLIFTIFQWWLKEQFGIEIPVASAPGFEIILGIPSLIVISYIINKKFKKS